MLAKIGLILFTLLYAVQAFTVVPALLLEIAAGIACVGLLFEGYTAIRKGSV